MPRRCPTEVRRQVIELARSGTKVARLAETFGMSDAAIYNWLKQERIDRGEVEGTSTEQALELAAAKRRIKQLETELAVSQGQARSAACPAPDLAGRRDRRRPQGLRGHLRLPARDSRAALRATLASPLRWEPPAAPTTMRWSSRFGDGCRLSSSTANAGRPGSSSPAPSTTTSSSSTTPDAGTRRSGCSPRPSTRIYTMQPWPPDSRIATPLFRG